MRLLEKNPFGQYLIVKKMLIRYLGFLTHRRYRGFNELKIEELYKIEPRLTKDVLKIFDLNYSVNSKKSFGGTSFDNIKKMITKYKKDLK